MKTQFTTFMRSNIFAVMCRLGTDALLGAVCLGLYGFIFGGFGALIQDEPHRLPAIASIFALGGGVAGLLIGACGEISNKRENRSAPKSECEAAEGKTPAGTAIRHLLAPSQRQPQNSLATVVNPDRRRLLSAGSKHPLSC